MISRIEELIVCGLILGPCVFYVCYYSSKLKKYRSEEPIIINI